MPYGGAPEDHAWYGGRLAPGAKLEVWSDRARTNRITNVIDAATGQAYPNGVVVCDDLGRYWFDLPDYTGESVYISPVGSTHAYRIDRSDLGQRVATLESGQAALSSNVDALSAEVDSTTATANNAHQIATTLQTSIGEPNGLAPLDDAGRLAQQYLPAGGDMGWINVASYGAVGDGVADDAGAIQGALDAAAAAGGGVVWIPGGIYSLQTLPLRIYARTRLLAAPDAHVRRDAAGTMLLNGDADQNFGGYLGHGDLVIAGGVWDANGDTVTSNNMVLSIGHARNVIIRDLRILDVPGYHAIELNSVHTGRIENVECRGFIDPGGREFSEAIQIDGAFRSSVFGGFGPYDHTASYDVEVRGCYIGPSSTAGSWGGGIGSHSTAPDAQHRAIRVVDNTIEGVATYGVRAYCWAESKITGNVITGAGAGVWVRSLDSSKTADQQRLDGTSITGSQPLSTLTVADNIITSTGTVNDAILVEGESTGPVEVVSIDANTMRDVSTGGAENGVRLIHVRDATVTGTVMHTVAGTGISTEDCDGLAIDGNRLHDVAGNGITLIRAGTASAAADNTLVGIGGNALWAQEGADVAFRDNTAYDVGLTTSPAYGVRITTNTAGATVSGNRLVAGAGTLTWAISATSTTANVKTFGNVCVGGGIDNQSAGADATATDTTL